MAAERNLASVLSTSRSVSILYFPTDFDGSGHYRCLAPGRQLNIQYGWEVALPPFVSSEREDGWLEVNYQFSMDPPRPDADIFVLQRRLERQTNTEGVDALHKYGKQVVVEMDDGYLHLPAYNPASSGSDPKTNPEANRDWFHEGMRRADAVSAATPALAEHYAHFNSNITVIRNYLDWPMWENVEQQSEVDRGGKVRVGWQGVLYWREGDLKLLAGLLGPWLEKNPHVEFVAAGDSTIHDMLGVPKGQRVSIPSDSFRSGMVPDITANMDIGLIPLAPNKFNEEKSWLKGLEYAACGIPCVASPTESYRSWVDEGVNGFLAKRGHDWVKKLDLLVNDDELRRKMGRAARDKVSRFTIQGHAHEWRDFFNGVLGPPVTEGVMVEDAA